MFDELLPYYSRELEYLRDLGAQFAALYPDKGRELGIGGQAAYADPHVERLIEATAFLTARIRQKLDDDFPEIPAAMLGTLYPNYTAPSPAKAIVQMKLAPGQEGLLPGYPLARGAALTTQGSSGDECYFQTCYDVHLYPIHASAAAIQRKPFDAPPRLDMPKPVCALALTLTCDSPDVTFDKMLPGRLRFMLSGHATHVNTLYELLFGHTTDVAVQLKSDADPVLLPAGTLEAVGFGREHGLVPYNAQSLLGYRIVSEYFSFPNKFHFFDITLPKAVLAGAGRSITLMFNLCRAAPEVEVALGPESFQLGCTPVVNLFTRRAEPVLYDASRAEYHLVPDHRRTRTTEIYSIDRVAVSTRGEEPQEAMPLFSVRHGDGGGGVRRFWHATRRPAVPTPTFNDRGTEMYISLVDLDLNPNLVAESALHADVTCLNRDLPESLPFGGGEPRMQLDQGGPVVVTCLTKPTATQRPDRSASALWRLVSHLSLNHLSISGGPEGAAALREVVMLYAAEAQQQSKVSSIRSVKSRGAARRISGGLARGIELEVELDADPFPNNDLFLFTAVLDRFLALQASINSFTQLSVRTTKGEFTRWQPRAGEMALL